MNYSLLQMIENSAGKQPTFCEIQEGYKNDHVCLEDKKEICLSCHIYGSHKDHKVLTLSQLEKEVSERLDILKKKSEEFQDGFAAENVRTPLAYLEFLNSTQREIEAPGVGREGDQTIAINTKLKDLQDGLLQLKQDFNDRILQEMKNLAIMIWPEILQPVKKTVLSESPSATKESAN